MERKSDSAALAMAMGAFVFWGLMPAYWKLIQAVPATEILGHRIFWSFVFLVFLVLVTGRRRELARETCQLLTSRRRTVFLIFGALIISLNWLTFIWAVNDGRVVEASLGYYINPLFNVLAGVLVLRERLSMWRFLAVLIAATGVMYLTVNYGSFPWVSLALASSMTAYSLCKKVTGLSAICGMTLETAITAPLALLFFFFLYYQGGGWPIGFNPTFILLAGAGVMTAIPLVVFAYSLNRLPLTVMGIVQYIAPTISLLLGILAFGETFTRTHLIAFALIWVALTLFTAASAPPMACFERRISNFLASKSQ